MMTTDPRDSVTELLRIQQAKERSSRRGRYILLGLAVAVGLVHLLATRGIVPEGSRDLALSAGAVVIGLVLSSR